MSDSNISNNDEKYLVIGKLGKTHGVRGWINLYSETHPASAILDYKPLYISTLTGWEIVNFNSIRQHGKNFIAHINEIDSPEKAKHYVGKQIAILRKQLPKLPPEEYYWSDLEGLTVINQNDVILGKIDHLMETGSNDVLVVVGKKRYLIPYIRNQFVLNIDLEKKIIRVDWDENF